MDTIDTLVIGAGVVGLAVAREIAGRGNEVIVVEGEDAIGTATSSRNSEVIHAGIYYAAGSLQARMCVRGRERMYRYCAERGVAHDRIGKLIVATEPAHLDALDTIARRAAANGVHDLRPVDRAELADLEPAVRGVAALMSPSTGIVDSHGLMSALAHDAESDGAAIVFRTAMTAARPDDGGLIVTLSDGQQVLARRVINAAGLGSWDVASSISGLPHHLIPPRHLVKGNYAVLDVGRAPFRHLIYPIPTPGGLGIHVTLDLAGSVRFGPDVEEVDTVDYSMSGLDVDRFATEIAAYWPELPVGSLRPAYCGIRPKIAPPDAPARDFVIQNPADHGIAGLINLFGIESPGLTSSLALGEYVADLLEA